MVKNGGLARVVLGQMYDFLYDKDLMIMDEDRESGSQLILALGRVAVDEEAKFRIMRGSVIGYGYDFQGKVDGEPAKQMYERAVKNTRNKVAGEFSETFLDSGVVDDRYGWYLTRI